MKCPAIYLTFHQVCSGQSLPFISTVNNMIVSLVDAVFLHNISEVKCSLQICFPVGFLVYLFDVDVEDVFGPLKFIRRSMEVKVPF